MLSPQSSRVHTTDDNFYDHYSPNAFVSANWNFAALGRWDTGANVYQWATYNCQRMGGNGLT